MTTNPFNRLFSRLAHVVPIDPERALFSSLAFGAAVLKRGQSLVWFLEGEISRSGELEPFKPGIGLLLSRYQPTAVPVAIRGTNRCLPRGRLIPHRGEISVCFGRAINTSELAARAPAERQPELIAIALHDVVAKLQESRNAKSQASNA